MATSKKVYGITVEIGGDTTKLGKALSGVETTTKNLQAELKGVNSLLKMDPKNVTLIQQKQDLLTKSVNNTKEKLDKLKDAQVQVQAQFDKGEITEEQFRDFQREIVSTEQKLKSLTKEAEQFEKQTSDSLTKAGQKLEDFGTKTADVGKKLLPVSAALAAAGGASYKMASDFTDAMAKVSTIADTSQVPLKDLQSEIIDLSNETGIASSLIADDVYNAISAGQQTGDAVSFVANSTKLAKAGFTDSAKSLDILTTILNAYGMEAGKVTNVSDILIATQNKGKVTVDELSSSMGKVIPTANAQNVSLENLASGYAIMTSKGINASETTTMMNAMLNELGKTGSKTDKILREETGKSFRDLMADGKSLGDVLEIVNENAKANGVTINEMFTSQEGGKAAFSLLTDDASEFNDMLVTMQNSAGMTEEAYEKMLTPSEKLDISMNKVKNAGISLGLVLMDMLGPMIQSIADAVAGCAVWFSNLDPNIQKVVATVGLLVAGLAPALIVIGKLTSSIGKGIKAFGDISDAIKKFDLKTKAATIAAKAHTLVLKAQALATKAMALAQNGLNMILNANPITIMIVAITALVAAILYLWNNSEAFRQFVLGMIENIKQVIAGFIEFILTMFSGIMEFLFYVFGMIKDFIVSAFMTAWENIVGTWNNVTGFFSGLWNGIVNVLSGVGTWFGDLFSSAYTNVCNAFSGIGGFFQGIWDKIVSTMSDIGTSVGNSISGAVKGVLNGVLSYIEKTINGAIDLLNGGINLINKIPGVDIGYIGQIQLPRMRNGGDLFEGRAIVGEAGPEEITMMNGKARIRPLTSAEKAEGVNGLSNITLNLNEPVILDGKQIGYRTAKYVSKKQGLNSLKFVKV